MMEKWTAGWGWIRYVQLGQIRRSVMVVVHPSTSPFCWQQLHLISPSPSLYSLAPTTFDRERTYDRDILIGVCFQIL